MAERPKAGRSGAADARRIQQTLRDIVAFTLSLPEVVESTSYGQPALKRGGRLLFALRKDLETLALVCGFDERAALVEADPQTFFFIDHYLNYPCVVVRLANARRRELRSAVEAAWRRLVTLGAKKPRPCARGKAARLI